MKFRYAFKISGATGVDRSAGLLRGVQVCSIGPASGHGVLVDQETLNRLNALAGQTAEGVRLKFNPDTFNHGEGAVVGRLVKGTFAIGDDGILRADAAIAKSYSGFDYLFELAETQPDTIALSVEFDGEPEDIGGVKYARPTAFFAAAIVDMGAATSGLFSVVPESAAKPKTKTEPAANPPATDPNMAAFTNEQMEALKALLKDALAPVSAKLTALESAKDDEKEPDTTGMSDEEKLAERLAAGVTDKDDEKAAYRKINAYRKAADAPVKLRDLTQFFAKAGGTPVSGGAQDMRNNKGDKCEFSVKLQAMIATGVKPDAAMKACIASFPALHRAYIARQMNTAGAVKAA